MSLAALSDVLTASAERHRHLCPRQVLGVRMGLAAGQVLGLALPQTDKRLLAILETDGCAADGVAVATNCWVGRRTMRLVDYGKVAATFVDTATGRAVRLAPRADIRARAAAFAAEARTPWEAQLLGYQRMPLAALLSFQVVQLETPAAQWVGRAGRRITCDHCGEEILNQRHVQRGALTLCRPCAGESYYGLPAGGADGWPLAVRLAEADACLER